MGKRGLNSAKLFAQLVILATEFLLAFIVAYLTVAALGMSVTTGTQAKERDVLIYMKSDGIHTDFVLPVQTQQKDWRTIFLPQQTKGGDTTKQFIAVGWGDQGFFLHTPEWSDLTFSTAFSAAFYLGKSAVHINYLNKEEFPENTVEVYLSRDQYQKLVNYIVNTLKKDQAGNLLCFEKKGYWDNDAFYEANGKYGLFHTCNSWVNSGLKEAELKACLWTPLNGGIFSKYRHKKELRPSN